MTNWSPDTCGSIRCKMTIEEDYSRAIAVLNKCPNHQDIADEDLFGVLRAENSLVQKVRTYLINTYVNAMTKITAAKYITMKTLSVPLPPSIIDHATFLVDGDGNVIVNDDGSITGDYYYFTGRIDYDSQRVLNLSIDQLSPDNKSELQVYLDQEYGTGKILVG